MNSKVTLTITSGNLKGREFTFDTHTTCIISCAKDCYPKIPDDEKRRTISRYHCLLDINPPEIRIRDFGSKNGTFVNGEKIGQREAHQTPEEAANKTSKNLTSNLTLAGFNPAAKAQVYTYTEANLRADRPSERFRCQRRRFSGNLSR